MKEIIDKITKSEGVRIVNSNNKAIIEIKQGGVWTPIVKDIDNSMAEEIVKQAKNRVICG